MNKISYLKASQFSEVAGEIDFYEYLENVKTGRWQDSVLQVRNNKMEKKRVPSVTVSGTFNERRRAANLKEHSGILGIDLDFDDNPNITEIRELLENDIYCHACHHSVRGFGLVWYVKINPEKHLDAFLAVEKYLSNKYNVIVDPSGKDVSRLRFVSYDPDLYLKEKSKKWGKYLLKKEVEGRNSKSNVVYHNDDIGHIMNQIQTGKNITEDYHSWLVVSFALASTFGEAGREYFHVVSKQSAKYNAKKSDQQYDIALNRKSSGITIGTFFYFCKEAGIEILTQTTQEAISIYRQRVKMNPRGDRKEAGRSTMEYMNKMHDVPNDRIKPIVDQLGEVSTEEIKGQKVSDKIKEIESFVAQLDLKRNIVTDRIELDGRPITDWDINSIYIDTLHAIDENIQKGKVKDFIYSNRIKSYHPFIEFFEKNINLRPTGRIKEVVDCFDYERPDVDLGEKDFLAMFLERWLLGIISSMHGTYSLLVLVLVGAQRTGKTKFFRGLLPFELQGYYAESKLDAGKDDEILMTDHLIIMDDEFGGKSKLEAKKFKEMSSREHFTIRKPYGTVSQLMKRYAVLCGTSNDPEVLNDATGNRRLIPVNVLGFDWERYEKIDKVELFMEMYWKWKEIGDGWMLEKEEIETLNESTSTNEMPTHEEELLAQYFAHPQSDMDPKIEYLTNKNIIQKLDQIIGKNLHIRQKNLGLSLMKLGYEKKRRRVNGVVKLVYAMICHIDSSPFQGEKIEDLPDF